MHTWVYDTAVAEWIRDGHSSLDFIKLTEKQWKIYFADGCIRKYSTNNNPFKYMFKYGNAGVGAEIALGIEDITRFFKSQLPTG